MPRPTPQSLVFRGFCAASLAAGCALAGCSAQNGPALTPVADAMHASPDSKSGKYIKHIVIVVQENRSFDNLFATFPGADGATSGKNSKGQTVQLKEQPLAGALDINHDYTTYKTEYDGGKMDGFDRVGIDGKIPAGTYPYQYVNPNDVQPYWALATGYALADHLFQTQGSGSFTAHQDLIAGGNAIDARHSIVDYPSEWHSWGCDAAQVTVTSLITKTDGFHPGQGPFPCFTYPTGTLRDLLDAHGVSWKYYAPPYVSNTVGALWNAFAAIDAVRNGPEWQTNISTPEQNVLTDAANGQLPAVSWVIPDQPDSDHPNGKSGKDNGPSWVAQVVNAIGGSSEWNSTAIVIVWDDWGGFYDHEPPRQLDFGGLGFRVPMIVVSPYTPAGEISHTQYEFGSILKFVEGTFSLGSLGSTDVRATSIGNMFNFGLKPRKFHQIQAPLSRRYFLHEKPSNLPVDRE